MASHERTGRQATRRTPPHNLPAHLTSFVGREREKAEIRNLIRGTRLITLTGSGGSGKTRLALETARELLHQFPDGVWLVELAPLSDPRSIPRAVAVAVGLRDESERPLLDMLIAHLQEKRVLVILDNCEHVIDACARVVDALVRACPELHIVTTGREPLGIQGETIWRVTSLSFPRTDETLAPEHLCVFDAPQLFVQRAAAASSQFAVTAQNAAAVAEVCRRLDGIPLAIELAAARIKGLAVHQIAARLDDRFRLLSGGSRAALPRQQTLRATMDWSYQLLSEPERTLLRRLAVFAGGFSLEAAEEVCGDDAWGTATVLELLLQLVDKSLTIADDRGEDARYHLLETVRQYAREQLLDADEARDVHRRHRDCYRALAGRAEAELRGPRQAAWLNRLELDHDNLRAALEWGHTDPAGAEPCLEIPAALLWFYFHRGHWTEARTWLEAGLARADSVPPPLRAKAMHVASFFALRQGDFARARELAERGLALCRERDDRENSVWLLLWLGLLALEQGNEREAERLLNHSLTLANERRDAWAWNLALAQLGILARSRADHPRATAVHSQCLALARDIGDPALIAYQLRNLGLDALNSGDYAAARVHYIGALALCREVDERWISGACLEGLAAVASANHTYRRAAELFGAGERLRELTGDSRSPVGDRSYQQHLAATMSALGDEAFAAGWAAGHSLTFHEAVQYAVEPDDPSAVEAAATERHADPEGAPLRCDPLSPREWEVAVLVSEGVSNRQIAARLFISERTAQTHVQHVLNKLGFSSRVQIAAWVVQRALRSQAAPN